MSEESITYYKYLNEDGSATRGIGYWPQPTAEGEPGEWVEVEGKLIPCVNGLHACRRQHLPCWSGASLYELEYAAPPQDTGNKVLGHKARLVRKLGGWNSKTQRFYAADCAEQVLHIFEDQYSHDKSVRKAIEAARALANDRISKQQALAAAADAADAADDTYYDAADAAYNAASAAYYAASAAYYADDAAYNAASAAAVAGQEREWQVQRILDYAYGREPRLEEGNE